ncbi:MAG: polymerase [Actinomycetota bacterium]
MGEGAGSQPTLLLLDGHSLAYRAFHALPDTMRTSTGQLTNAVYGFTSMLLRVLDERDPDAVAVAFDVGRDVDRTAAFPLYKAQREAPPEEFGPQVDLIREVLRALAVPILEVPGVEADDVIATVATNAVADGYRVRIVTGDRDAMQLVSDDVLVLYTLKGMSDLAEMTPEAVLARFGVPPSRYVELAALRGDSSDNLPGVPGVGDKTAAKLLTQLEGLDGVYARLDEVPGKRVPAMLAEHREQVELNRRLMTLRRDVEVGVTTGDLARREADADELVRLFSTLEFRSLLERFGAAARAARAEPRAAVPTEVAELAEGGLADWLVADAGPVAVIAVTSGRPPDVRLEALGLARPGDAAVVVEAGRLDGPDGRALARWLADEASAKVTHDAKRLEHAAMSRGWGVAGLTMDSELAAYLLEPERRGFELAALARERLGVELDGEAVGAQPSLGGLDEAGPRAAAAASALVGLAPGLLADLEARGQAELLARVELPLAPVLARLERVGIAVDLAVLSELRGRFTSRLAELEREIHDHAGHPFNVASNPQLQQVLFEELGLPPTRRIKTGFSTDASALSELVAHHPIAGAILDWRELSKLLTTYVDALPPLVDARTGRVHTTLSQTTAATGRLSSSNPNLQNVPVRGEEGRAIRRAFVAGEGYATLLVADYSQIELRLLAHLSGDEGLRSAFAEGEDIHVTTAARVFSTPVEDVDATLRDRAKAVNYGLAYGLTAFGLARQLGIGNDEAQTIVDAYFSRFPGVRGFLDEAVAAATRDGFTTTLLGRRRYLPDLTASDRTRRQMAERMAMNAPIQGTAADIIKLAMVELDRALARAGLASRQLLQVHDEVILEVVAGEEEAAREVTERALSGVLELSVPLEVDTAFGVTWYDAQKH